MSVEVVQGPSGPPPPGAQFLSLHCQPPSPKGRSVKAKDRARSAISQGSAIDTTPFLPPSLPLRMPMPFCPGITHTCPIRLPSRLQAST